MVLYITDLKTPQKTLDMRKLGSQTIMQSGKPAKVSIVTSPHTHAEITAKDVARSRNPYPVNRIFGFAPSSHGTRLSNKWYLRRLADTQPYEIEKDGVPVNDQRQLTNQEVVGLNIQKEYTIKQRFADFNGNSKQNAKQRVSRVKHADDASKSDVTKVYELQRKNNTYHPKVIDAIKRSTEMAKIIRKHSKRSF